MNNNCFVENDHLFLKTKTGYHYIALPYFQKNYKAMTREKEETIVYMNDQLYFTGIVVTPKTICKVLKLRRKIL